MKVLYLYRKKPEMAMTKIFDPIRCHQELCLLKWININLTMHE